ADVEMLKMMGLPRGSLSYFKSDSVFIYIQMQLCNYSLCNWLDENQATEYRDLPRMKSWFKQIVSAVDYIHEKNLIHRDLKPSNILFAEKDLLRVCDLGIVTQRSVDDEPATTIFRTVAGTVLYMSPEQRSIRRYSSKTDVFTLGLILVELCVAMSNALREQTFENYRRGIHSELVEEARTAEFVGRLIQEDPKDRPTCREMLDDLYLC
ncbi:hypothetical protein PENTCL1PPCAC_8565, partial [Pristionchus entomophagus]